MNRTQFINHLATDGSELAVMYAQMLGVSRAQIQLWLASN